MSPSYALIRRINNEERFIAEIANLYSVSNYDLTKFNPKKNNSFSSGQLYGLKQADANGVLKILKCKIIILRDTEEEINDVIKSGKLPRSEPARFESAMLDTEDFSIFELAKETKSVRASHAKSASSKPTNRAMSASYIKKTETEDNKTIEKSNKSSEKKSKSTTSEKKMDSKTTSQEANMPKEKNDSPSLSRKRKISSVIDEQENTQSPAVKKPRVARKIEEHKENKDDKIKIPKDIKDSAKIEKFKDENKDSAKTENSKDENKDSAKTENSKDENKDSAKTEKSKNEKDGKIEIEQQGEKSNSAVNDEDKTEDGMQSKQSEPKSEIKQDTQITPLSGLDLSQGSLNEDIVYYCGKALITQLTQTVDRLSLEVSHLNTSNQTLQTSLDDIKQLLSNQSVWSSAGTSSTLAQNIPADKVDLGGSSLVNREWAEKCVWKEEKLKWKLDKLLNGRAWKSEELLKFWFDPKLVIKEEGDSLYPDDSVKKIQEFFDETNNKKSEMEILKQQKRLRLRITNDAEYEERCKQVRTSITMQNVSVEENEIRKQIGKVLYDVKKKWRDVQGLPPRKVKVKTEPTDDTKETESDA